MRWKRCALLLTAHWISFPHPAGILALFMHIMNWFFPPPDKDHEQEISHSKLIVALQLLQLKLGQRHINMPDPLQKMKIFKCRNSTWGPKFVLCEVVWIWIGLGQGSQVNWEFASSLAGIWPGGLFLSSPCAVEVPSISGACKEGFKSNISNIFNRQLNSL